MSSALHCRIAKRWRPRSDFAPETRNASFLYTQVALVSMALDTMLGDVGQWRALAVFSRRLAVAV